MLAAFLEFLQLQNDKKNAPGDIGFDPLRLYTFRWAILKIIQLISILHLSFLYLTSSRTPYLLFLCRSSFNLYIVGEEKTREQKIADAKKDMELCEIKNGRLAMVSVQIRA